MGLNLKFQDKASHGSPPLLTICRMTHPCVTLCAPYGARVVTHGMPYLETRGGDPFDALF